MPIHITGTGSFIPKNKIKNSSFADKVFFDKDGNYDFKKWMIEVEGIADENGPVIIMCRSGRRSRIVSNMIIKGNSEYLIYHATNGIKSWIESNNKTIKPD